MPVSQSFVDTIFTDWFITNHTSITWSGGGTGDAYFTTVGNGSSTTFVLTHNLGTADVFVMAYDLATLTPVIPDQVLRSNTTQITIGFIDPPVTNSMRIVVWKLNTYVANIGDGATTALTVTHSLATRDVIVQCYDNTTLDMIYPDVVHTTTNTLTVTFVDAPATNSIRVIVGNASTASFYRASIGDGTATSIVVTHNKATRDIVVELYDNTTFEVLYADIEYTSTNTITVTFIDPPTTNNVRVLVGTSIAAGAGDLDVAMQYYTRAPSFFSKNDSGVLSNNISQVQGLADLDVSPGWQRTQFSDDTQTFKTLKTSSGDDYNVALTRIDGVTPIDAGINEGYLVTDTTGEFEEEVVSAVFYIKGTVSGVVNPVIFAARSLFGPGSIIRNGTLLGQATSGGVTGWLLSFTSGVLRQGPLSFIQTDVPWEPSNTVHIWPQPQRVNLLGNPSFEGTLATVPFGWTAGTTTGVAVPLTTTANGLGTVSWQVIQKQSIASVTAGHIVCTLTTERHHTITLGTSVSVQNVGAPFDGTVTVFALTPTTISYIVADTTIVAPTATGADATIIPLDNPRRNAGLATATVNEILIQSNFFPRLDRHACVSAYLASSATATMQARVGMICWDDTFTISTFVFGDWTPIAQYPSYHRVADVIDIPDDRVEGQLVVHIKDEVPVVVYIDNCAVEFADSFRDYFDGDTSLGLTGDFSWLDTRNASVSLWYNNFANTEARLFTHYDTTVQQARPGLTEDWVPTGSQVLPHWKFFKRYPPGLWAGDYRYHVGDVSAFRVTPLP